MGRGTFALVLARSQQKCAIGVKPLGRPYSALFKPRALYHSPRPANARLAAAARLRGIL